jgi:hypothetical protein
MQEQLADPGPASVNHKNGSHIIRHIGKYLGGLLTVAIIAILAINSNRSNKKAISKTAKQQATIVAPAAKSETKGNTIPDTLHTTGHITTLQTGPTKPGSKQTPPPMPAMTLFSPPVTSAEEPATAVSENIPPNNTYNKLKEPETPKPDARALLSSFFDEVKKAEQEFYIDVAHDTTLIAKGGTQLVFPANIFMTTAGPVTGKVKIIIREYIRYDEIIANKLNTTSNGEQLVTGGMLHISVQQDGKEVSVMPKKAIAVSIPTSHYDNQMMLFRGTEIKSDAAKQSAINWIPEEPLFYWSDWPVRSIRTINITTVEPASVTYGKKTTAKFYLNKEMPLSKTEIIPLLKKRFGSYYDNIKIKRVRPGRTRQRSATGEDIVIDSVEVDAEKVLAKMSKRLNGFEDTMPGNRYNYETKNRQQDQYRFTINKLGWINCDRFRMNPSPRIKFTVNLGNDITFDNCFQQLVFTRYQSVLFPDFGYRNTVEYERVPEGEPVILVTIAIRAGKVVSCFTPLNITKKEVGNLVFEPTTPEQFKQNLHALFATQQ